MTHTSSDPGAPRVTGVPPENREIREREHRPLLVEREAQLDLLEVVLDRTERSDGQLVFLEGPPGAGKTALVEAVSRDANARGYTVLAATATTLESGHVLGIVTQLLDPLLRPVGRSIDRSIDRPSAARARRSRAEDRPGATRWRGPAAVVEETLVGMPHEERGDRLASGAFHYGMFWLVAELAESTPVLIVVDDLQWADAASVECLVFLARRVHELPVAIVLAARSWSAAGDARVDLTKLRSAAMAHRIAPPPLSKSGVRQLVHALAPPSANHEELAEDVYRTAAGNPFLSTIAVRLYGGGRDEPDSAEQLLAEVEHRLADLPPPAASFARAVAVAEPSVTFAEAAEIAQLAAPVAKSAAAELRRSGWLRTEDPPALLHPLVREAVYHLAGPEELDRLHRRAVTVLRDAGHPVDLLAAHAQAAAPAGDGAMTRLLSAAAGVASHRDSAAAAVRLLERAIAEPPDPLDRPAILAQLALASAAALTEDMTARFSEAVEAAPGPAQRCELRASLARVLVSTQRAGEAVDVLDEALADDPRDDRSRTTELVALRLVALRMDPLQRQQWREAVDQLSDLDLDGDVPALRAAKAELAYAHGVSGEHRGRALELLHDALSGPQGPRLLFTHPQAFATAMHAAQQIGEAGLGYDVAEAAARLAQERGHQRAFRLASAYVGMLAVRLGLLSEALAASASLDLLERELPVLVPLRAATTVAAYTALGDLDAARAALELPGGTERYEGELTFGGYVEALGWLLLAEDRAVEALRTFSLMGAGAPTLSGAHPATNLWRSGAARAAMRLGDLRTARELAEAELELARSFGAPRPLGISLTTSALVAPEPAVALPLLESAIEALVSSGDSFALTTAQVEQGRLLAEAGRRPEADDVLRVALDAAHRGRYAGLADRAELLLRQGGSRPRSRAVRGVESLTPAELRVARAAALTRRTNAEIAADLFVSRKAIEFHLSNAYRKLGVRGREGLRAALGAADDDDGTVHG